MKPLFVPRVITFVFAFLFCTVIQAQTFGTSASAVWISDCNQDNFFNTSGSIGPASNTFTSTNFGTHTQNSGTLILRGGEVWTFKSAGTANVCSVHMYYRVYPQTGTPGPFTKIDLPLADNCNSAAGQYPSGGTCAIGDQKWSRVSANGSPAPDAPVDLTELAAGNYTLEVYYDVTGSSASTTQCDETRVLNNGGNNYKASFSIQSPLLVGANPTTCGGFEGSIIINGLTAGANYSVGYSDNGNPVAPANMTANGAGQIIIAGLNAGLYSDFELAINGCTTDLNTGVILSNPVLVPKFSKIAPFCAGSMAPALPATSQNGITGTWNPSIINNQASGSYTFTPNSGQCGTPLTINVTVNPVTIPTFSFGTSASICAGGNVPVLPSTSNNGIAGTWNPSVVDKQHSATYTFTPSGSQCAAPATFSVTVSPNIVPSFSFGTTMSICAGNNVPALPPTSANGITGTWSPSVIDNQSSGVYTFTPDAGQCATKTLFILTVHQNVTPAFSFGTSLNICAGGSVPSLPATSQNGISGTWSPASVDNQASGVYTFTPAAGACAPPVIFTVTVSPNTTPSFSFGTSLSVCSGGSVPALPKTSGNGITGTWNPSVVDNQHSGNYTFTPDPGQCATNAVFSVTVQPNVVPAFSFGTSATNCDGSTVPSLPSVSMNGITGSWSPSTVDNQHSGVYTFTPGTGQCAVPVTFTVTVNPMITPVFGFGSALSVCAGSTVPSLPATSSNGINGTWTPSVIDNQTSGIYVFHPSSGLCAATFSLNVTIIPNATPVFSFGNSLSICNGGTVPALPSTSTNGITGTWSPSAIDNQHSASYTFTPDAGQCAIPVNLSVTVNPVLTPSFSFGTSMSICAGSGVPALPSTSSNGIAGSWNPAVINNQQSGTYTFTPATGQCATATSLNVVVNPNIIPTFSFGTSLTICAGSAVPSLPASSLNGLAGTWSPATVSNQASGVYTFTPDPVPGKCLSSTNFTVTVNQIVSPAFSFGPTLTLCSESTVPALPATSVNGIKGSWSPSVISNKISGTYTFTSDPGQCSLSSFTLAVNITPVPVMDPKSDTSVNDGSFVPENVFSGSPQGVNYHWTNSNTSIGLGASGTGNVPSFTAVNKGGSTEKGTITITPVYNGCSGTAKNYTITVIPLAKDVFVPNVFSPNGDGKNDVLYAYSNYITKLEMRIFNQWGQQVQLITDPHNGWDGRYKGVPQPVGVYVYTLKAVLTDGRSIQLTGNVTLVR